MKRFLHPSIIRKSFRFLFFLLLLTFVFSAFCNIFCFKYNDGIYGLKTLYDQEKDTVDVLVIGSSHAFENIHTGVLYDDFGIASFTLGGSVQPLWNSYHYLIEALKTQTPALVILEGYRLVSEEEYQDHSRIIKNTFGFKPSLNQLENLRVSAPEGQFWKYFFHFYSYHNRYEAALSSKDFFPNQGMRIYDDWKGFLPNYYTMHFDVPDRISPSETQELHPKTEMYYRKIIELCQSKDIPLHIVVAPFYAYKEEQMRVNRGAQIASEYGIPFTDYNQSAMQNLFDFDYGQDMADGNHLNASASIRFTHTLGEMLCSLYNLPDRRNDSRFSSWARSSAYYQRDFANHELRIISHVESYLSRIAQDSDYTVVISITGYCADYFNQIVPLLEPLGINDIYFPYAMNGTWVIQNRNVINRWQENMAHPYICLNNHSITFNGDHKPILDKVPISLVDRGFNIIVYDHITETIVDTVGFDPSTGFSAVR